MRLLHPIIRLELLKAANRHITTALDVCKQKRHNILVCGYGYKKTMEFAGLTLKENWHKLMYDFFANLSKL